MATSAEKKKTDEPPLEDAKADYNPYDPAAEPAAHQSWAARHETDTLEPDARRSELQSARYEDAGLHPQQGTNIYGIAEVLTDVGDASNRKGSSRARVTKNAFGETPAEQYRRELRAEAPPEAAS